MTAPRAPAKLITACPTYDSLIGQASLPIVRRDLHGLHLLGKISLGMEYPSGIEEAPKPISICATISL